MSALDRLLSAVALRERLACAGRAAAAGALAGGGLSLAWLLAARLTGILPEAPPWLLGALPLAGAAVLTALRLRPVPVARAARLADAALASDDLLLTAAGLGASPTPGYAEAVLVRAETVAAKAVPAQVRPWQPLQRSLAVAGLAAVLAAGWWLAPQFNPFGREAERAALAQRAKQLQAQRQQAKARIEELKKEDPAAVNSQRAADELKRLVSTFDGLKPGAKPDNAKSLLAAQKLLAEELLDAKARAFVPADAEAQQRFGGDRAGAEGLAKELARGDARQWKQELDAAAAAAEKLGDADPVKRAEAERELRKRLERMADALGGAGKDADQALRQALEQLARAGGDEALRREALGALQDQLQRAQLELDALAQGGRDKQALEDALGALAQARRLNEQGACPGGKPGSGLEAYKRMYEEALAQAQGQGQGPGDRKGSGMGPGQGEGRRPENPDAKSDFTDEKSPSQLAAGKHLMQWSVRGPSEKGTATEDYRAAVQQVRQGVSEAIDREQLPPGYHGAVRAYFDDLPAEPGK